MTLLAASADPLAVLTPLLEAVRQIDPNQPVFNVRDFRSYFEGGALGLPRMLLRIVSAAGLLGLGLALVGLYGLVSYAVSLRTREIGIRMAIGANRGAILRLVAGQGTRLSLVGSLVGVALSVPLFRLLSANMAGLGGLSPWTLVVVPVALMGVTVCACLIPARRAARVDPTIALRSD